MIFEEFATIFGGCTKLAKDLGLTLSGVWRWCERGVPAKHWEELIKRSHGKLNAEKLYRLNSNIRAQSYGKSKNNS